MKLYKKRIISFPEQRSSFLFGARGSGKTRLLKHRFPGALYIDLLDRAVYQAHLSNPALFYNEVNAFKEDGVVVVDEIQKIPDLLNEVHRLIEESSRNESPKRQFILTGSSTRKLKKAGENLLAGRASKRILHPFVPEELGQDFNLNTALRYGLLPVVWSSVDREEALKNYVQMYLKEEIEAEGVARNLSPFIRFLEVAGLFHGQVVNMSNIASECGVSKQAVQSFFSVLEDTMLGFFIPAYLSRLKLKEQKHRKFYLTDPGLARVLKKNFGPVVQEEKGFLFEGLVAQILRAYKEYKDNIHNPLCESLSYWSPSDAKKTEVDFILKKGKGLVAIEVKAKDHVSSKDYKGLLAIGKLPEVKKRIVVYMGKQILKTEEGIDVWPFDYFCKVLKEGSSFEDSDRLYEPSLQVKKNTNQTPPLIDLNSEGIGNYPLPPSKQQIPPPESGEDFEAMCLDLYKVKFGDQAQLHGRQGQAQYGVDIFVQNENIGIQCKKREANGEITKKELEEEVKKAKNFQPPLKRFILATTCKRDGKIQKVARTISKQHKEKKLFSVAVDSWHEIKLLFDKYPSVYEKYYHKKTYDSRNTAPGYQSQKNNLTPFIQEIRRESHNRELKRIRDLIKNQQPQTALNLLKTFKEEQWNTLDHKTKYQVLHYMGHSKIRMNQIPEGDNLLIQALQYNKEDEDALINCASACFRRGRIKEAKKHIEKVKTLNPQNEFIYILEAQILDQEEKSLKEIIRHIPDDLKNNPRVALVLCDISRKKESDTEFLKWLKIFDKNRPQDDTDSDSDYASLVLKGILKKESVLTASRVPDELKPEIEKVISIYKNLLQDSKNHEVIKFRPQWYKHYALALYFNGQYQGAIKELEAAIEKFPNDESLKEECGIMHAKKGDKNKAVFYFEQLTNKSTEQKCMLLNLYFQNRQYEKAHLFFKETGEDPSLSKKDRLEIKKAWVAALLDNKQTNKAEKELNTFFEQDRDSVRTLILKSAIEERKGHIKETKQYLKQAYELYKSNKNTVHFMDKPFLAMKLYRARMYDLCEELFEEVIGENLYHPAGFHLLHTYFENGKNKKTIELAQKICKIFPNQFDPVDILFRVYNEMGDRKSALKQYEDFFSRTGDIKTRVELIYNYVFNDQVEEARKLFSTITDDDIHQLSPDKINKLSVSYMKTGEVEKSLKTQYQGIKLHPGDLNLKMGYVSLMTLFPHQTDNHPLFQTKEVTQASRVKIKETLSGEVTEIVIGEGAFPPEHELVKKLSGKSVGSVVSLNDKQYQVVEIRNKYVHQFQQILKNVELEDPSQNMLKQGSIPKNPSKEDMEKALKSFMPNIQQDDFHKILKYHTEGKAPIGTLYKKMGWHPVKIISNLMYSTKHKWRSSTVGRPEHEENIEVLTSKPNVVLDISSLLALHWLKMETYLAEGPFRLFVCQSTIDSLRQLILTIEPHLRDGLLMTGFDKENKLRKNFIPAENMKQKAEFLNKIKAWCHKHCQTAVLPVFFEMSRKKRRDLSQLVGEEFLDPVLFVHKQKNKVLLTEDGVLAGFAAGEFCISRVRLWDIIRYFEKEAVVDNKQSVKLKAELIKLNQTYIPIDHQVLVHLLKEAEYHVTDRGFQQGLFFLGPASHLEGAIMVTADFLRGLFQESAVLPFHKREITKEVLNHLCRNRLESLHYIAEQLCHLVKIKTRLMPLHQAEILKSIREWQQGKVYE